MTGDNTLIHSHGINRRDFMKLCAALAATMGLSSKAAAEMAAMTLCDAKNASPESTEQQNLEW